MSGRARAVFRARCGQLRQFAVSILVLAIGALVLQVPVHASPAGHAIHQQQAAATASHCAEHHMPDDHGAGPSAGCVNTDVSPNLVDCCQTCLAAAVLVAPPEFGPPVNGEAFTVVRHDPHDRSPEGILRPPRLAAA
ncbi:MULTISPECIES: hypothetical protein [Alphaproteobacteria]|uniref:CopL family metal-binding regulatory protein n=1 Tax=Devosia honganensis TaxID=1610527 RepID=A0ABV7X148_9HYPH|nr:hypothetical protein [Gemmobacter sp.]